MEDNSSLQLSLVDKHTLSAKDLRYLLLSDLFIPQNISSNNSKTTLTELGGIQGLCHSLNSHWKFGIQGDKDDRKARKKAFGKNKPFDQKAQSFWLLVWECFLDTTLQILIVAAVVSLIVGTIQNPEDGQLQGVTILVAIAVVVLVTSLNNYTKELMFRKLNMIANSRLVTVIRDGVQSQISIFKMLVGDLFVVSAGDILPVDACVVWSSSLTVDESSLPSQSESVLKGLEQDLQPFLISGSQVTEGWALAIVLAVGDHSFQRKVRNLFQEKQVQDTPLQQKLNRIAQTIAWIGLTVAICTFLVLLVYVILDAVDQGEWDNNSWSELIESFIIGVTIVVVAVPQGLPLAVTLSLAFSVTHMLRDKNLVRHLKASETMGQATAICTDKTGTVTMNVMKVLAVYTQGQMYQKIEKERLHQRTFDIFIQMICQNTTGSTGMSHGIKTFSGNRTDIALLDLAQDWGVNYTEIRNPDLIVAQVPFNSRSKRTITVIRHQGKLLVLVKGASEEILKICSEFITQEGNQAYLSEQQKSEILTNTIADYASRGLRTITLAFKYLDQDSSLQTSQGQMENLQKNLILLGIVGIKDPIRHEVPDAISTCQNAGIVVRMITGDHRDTAIAVGRQSRILPGDYNYDPDDFIVMEGYDFRQKVGGLQTNQNGDQEVVNLQEFKAIVSQLKVLARSSPLDKFIIVTGLRQLGQIVAVTGDGTNDAPALKQANVGFSMHQCGTRLAQEAADIILLDDNFASVVNAVLWGRNIYDSIRKFIQFQLTVNLVALLMCFIGACVIKASPLSAVQMLWVNLIMDTFAALALATEPPSEELLKRMPVKQSDFLITPEMVKMIMGQTFYQGVWLLVILFVGPYIFGIQVDYEKLQEYDQNNTRILTIFFNSFVYMQVFNEINCRKLKSSQLNVFKGIFRNWLFILIVIFTIGVQVLIVSIGGKALNVVQLSFQEHMWCLLIGLGGLVFGFFVRLMPNRPFQCCKFSEKPLKSTEADKGITSLIRRKTSKRITISNRALTK